MMTLSSDSTKTYAWLLIAVCVVSLFPFLGETLFNTRGEPREAVVALSMLQDGNWILPINNGVDMAYKPPFFHWFVAILSYIFGGVSEYTSRMPSAIALSVMVLAGYFFYARRKNVQTAFVMGLVTLTNFEVHRAGVACRVDMVLTLMMVLSLYQLYRWVERDMRGLPWWGVLCLSGAFLSKGPVGAALPCLTVAVFAWLRGMSFWRVLWHMVVVGLMSCVLPLVWYVAAWQQGGQRFLDLIYEENILRLMGKMSYESHINPWYYNVVTLVSGFVPYTLLIVMSLFTFHYRKPALPVSQWWSRMAERVRSMDAVRLFTLVSFVVIFVFYCIPKSKRSVYLLPVYPFLAYYIAEFMLWLMHNRRRILVCFGWVIASLAALLPTLYAVVRMGLVPESIFGGRHAVQNVAMLAALRDAPIGFGGVVAYLLPLLAAGGYVWCVKRKLNLIYGVTACVFALFFSLDGLYQPLVLNTKSDKPLAERIAAYVPQGKVYSFRTDVTPGNPLHPFTINYYLGDRVVPFTGFMPASGYLIVGDNDIEAFRVRYPQYQVAETIDFHHKSCDDRRMLHLYQFRKQ